MSRVVVITGAAGGIGSAYARLYAQRGWKVAMLDVDGDALATLAAESSFQTDDIWKRALDITQAPECESAAREILDRFGGVNVLINNAGRTHLGSFEDTNTDVLRTIMEINVFGALNLTKALLPALKASRGAVVAMSSVAGLTPLAGRCGYSGSKHALHGFFESMRIEWAASGVRVMLVCPSFVRSDIGKRALGADGGPASIPRTQWGSPMEPAELAEIVYRGVEQGRRTIIIPIKARFAVWLHRRFPSVFDRLMARQLGTG